ncbi:MAG: type II secretion system F family protein, partial [Lachnospiraceae bacterium]
MASQIHAKPLSNLEIAAFCNQMALILKSGISSMEGISIMIEDAPSAEESKLLHMIEDTLSQTGRFSKALADTHAFP